MSSPDDIRDINACVEEDTPLGGHVVLVRDLSSETHVDGGGTGDYCHHVGHLCVCVCVNM